MKKRIGYVYVLHNLVNDKEYVGQTIREPEYRWAGHINAAFIKRDNRPLYRAMRRDGLKNFTAEVIWSGSELRLNAAEKRFIRQRQTFRDTGWGYNLTLGGGQAHGLSRWSRQKISRAARQQFASKKARRLLSTQAVQRWMRPDYRAAVTSSVRQRIVSTATRQKLSKAGKLRFSRKGERAKISVYSTAIWKRPERRARHSVTVASHAWANLPKKERVIKQPNKSYPKSELTKKRMGVASRAHWKDPVYRKRVSKMMKRRWAERRERLANAA